MQEKLTPFQVIAAAATLSSLGGLSALLRSGAKLGVRNVCAAMLYSFLFGMAYCMVWYNYFDGEKQNFFFLIGTTVAVGLGGMTCLDFVVQVLLRGKVSISVKAEGDKQEPPEAPGG